jgi:predicted DNA-binding transcriptional regulator YafY
VDEVWDEAELEFTEADSFAPYQARFADEVLVTGPPDLREAVIQQLKRVIA